MKWIEAPLVGDSPSGKTKIWIIRSKEGGLELGRVKWWAAWRKYVFYPGVCTLFEQDCLRDIAEFVEQATREHKGGVRT